MITPGTDQPDLRISAREWLTARYPFYQAMTADLAGGGLVPGREVRRMNQTVRFQEILRRLAIIDEGFAEDQAGLGLGLPASWLLDVFVPARRRHPRAGSGQRGQGQP